MLEELTLFIFEAKYPEGPIFPPRANSGHVW